MIGLATNTRVEVGLNLKSIAGTSRLASFCRYTRKVLRYAAFSRPTYHFRLPSPQQRGRGAGG